MLNHSKGEHFRTDNETKVPLLTAGYIIIFLILIYEPLLCGTTRILFAGQSLHMNNIDCQKMGPFCMDSWFRRITHKIGHASYNTPCLLNHYKNLLLNNAILKLEKKKMSST